MVAGDGSALRFGSATGQGTLAVMVFPALPASVWQRIRDGAAVIVVAPGLAGPPWPAPIAGIVEALAGFGVTVVSGDGDGGDAGDDALRGWLEALLAAVEPIAVPDDADDLAALEAQARAEGDWPRVIDVLVARVEHTAGAAERSRGLREVAAIYEAELGDLPRAFAASVTACHLAPDDDAAVALAARLASETDGWTELVREAARIADEVAGGTAARWMTRAGDWYATKLGDLEAAMQAYEAAAAADPGAVAALEALVELYGETGSTDEHRGAIARLAAAIDHGGNAGDAAQVSATLRLAEALVADAEAQPADAASATWRDADRRYRELLARHRSALSEGQTTAIWARLGGIARTLGDPRAAETAYRRVIEREPLHDAARVALVELAEARGEWRTVIDLRNDELEALTGVPDSAARRARLHERIGDVWHDRLRDPGAAIAAYEQAVALAASRGVLHKLLEAFTAARKWPRALEALERLAAEEPAPDRRARFHYAAAVIARDELDDAALAIAQLTAALDTAPLTPGAFDALDALLTGDAAQRARALRRQLTRLGDADPAILLELWLRLADVCLDQLDDRETAIAAYQVACELAPEEPSHRERLTELLIEAASAGPVGAPRRRDAIAELQALIARAPERIELYKALSELYGDGRRGSIDGRGVPPAGSAAEGRRGSIDGEEADAAWCVAQVLVLLGAASDDEARRFARGRPQGLAPVSRRLTEEHWQAIAHPAEDRRIGAVFELVGAAIALDTAQPIAGFGLDAAARIDLERDGRAASRLLQQVIRGLAIEPAPMIWFDTGDGLRIANMLAPGDGRARLAPSLLVGERALGRAAPRDLAFAAGKRLAYLRPDRFVAFAVATVPRLEAAFAAARCAGDPSLAGAAGDDVRALAHRLRGQLAAPVIEQLAERAQGVGERGVAAWRAATDLTANRAGLVISNDLDAAVRAIAIEGTTFSGLSVKDRIRDLLGFAVSDPYFAVRRHLGQRLHDEEVVARAREA